MAKRYRDKFDPKNPDPIDDEKDVKKDEYTDEETTDRLYGGCRSCGDD